MTRSIAIVLTLLIVTAGVGPVATAATAHTPPTASTAPAADSTASTSTVGAAQTTDTADAEIGCFDGVCHDDELGFEEPTNLTDAELDALTDRTMARVEELRGENFDSQVPVEIQGRAAFREDNIVSNAPNDESFNRWNDQVWKALFVVGDDRTSADAIDATVGSAVNGFYVPSEDRIVIVSPTPDSPTVSELTLLHELTHALQDQRHDLAATQFRGQTQDADLAVDGVVEGEAVYLEYLYEDRCRSGQWECFDDPQRSGGSGDDGGAPSNPGVLFLLLQPYSDGPVYVHETIEADGWEGVDHLLADPPTTTTEIIHRQPVEPTPLDTGDEATAGWEPYPDQGRNGAEVAGEASIYIMLWYQAREYDADTIDPASIREADSEYDRYNYAADPSAGWVADEIVPYQRGDDDGYVWTTEWETERDATEFQRAYGAILEAHDATETENGTYVVSNGSFSGAYAVDTDGTTVTLVHAPTDAGLFELDPSLDPDTVDSDSSIFTEDVPGFGIAATAAALLALLITGRRLT